MGCSKSKHQSVLDNRLPNRKFVLMWNAQRPCAQLSGRGELLQVISSRCSTSGSKLSLQGPSGIGKTELARAFAYSALHEYARVIWIDFNADPDEQFLKLASTARLEGINPAHEVYRHLSKSGQKSLFIFDNWDDSGSTKYLPRVSKLNLPPSVIIIGDEDAVDPLQIGGLNPEDGSLLFERYAKKLGVKCSNPGTQEDLRMLSRRLNGYPPALEFCARVIFYSNETINETVTNFIDALPENETDIEPDFKALWEATTAHVQQLPGGAHALKVLCILNFIDPDGTELHGGSDAWSDLLPGVDARSAMTMLAQLSFITQAIDVVSIHPKISWSMRLNFLTSSELVPLFQYLTTKSEVILNDASKWDHLQLACRDVEWTLETWGQFLLLCFDATKKNLSISPFNETTKRRVRNIEMDHPELIDLRSLVCWAYDGPLFLVHNVETAAKFVKGDSFSEQCIQIVALSKCSALLETMAADKNSLTDDNLKLLGLWLAAVIEMTDLEIFGLRVKFLFDLIKTLKVPNTKCDHGILSDGIWASIWQQAYRHASEVTEEFYWSALSQSLFMMPKPEDTAKFTPLAEAFSDVGFHFLVTDQLQNWNQRQVSPDSLTAVSFLNVLKILALFGPTCNPYTRLPQLLRELGKWTRRALMEEDDKITYALCTTWYMLASKFGRIPIQQELFLVKNMGNVQACFDALSRIDLTDEEVYVRMAKHWEFKIDITVFKSPFDATMSPQWPFVRLLLAKLQDIAEAIVSELPGQDGPLFTFGLDIANALIVEESQNRLGGNVNSREDCSIL